MKRKYLAAALCCALILSLGAGAAAADRVVLSPSGLLAQADGGLLIADQYHRAIWRQSPDGTLTRLAGREGTRDVNGAPLGGYHDGPAADAAFQAPWAIAPYLDGWAITDTDNHAVRHLGSGAVDTLAGTGKSGSADGLGMSAAFDTPTGLTAGPDGCLYVSDTGNSAIRRIDTQGHVTTLLSSSSGLSEPTGLYFADGVLYVADSGNNRICKVVDGALTVLAGGAGESDGYRNGPAAQALFSHPQGLTVRGDTVYIADTGNGAVRMLQNGKVSTLIDCGAGDGGLYPVSPRALALVGETLYVGDVFARALFTISVGSETAFSDVPAGAWFASSVDLVCDRGLMSGSVEGLFAPAQLLNRNDYSTILSALNTTAPELQDGASQSVTRAELALALQQAAIAAGLDTASGNGMDYAAFQDSGITPTWAEAALRWALSSGILTGKPGGLLDPTAPVTRAETAVMLSRYLDWSAAQ